ncbi:MAG: hypothetical protein ABI459_08745 [Deltaproteobacteria bacterium]
MIEIFVPRYENSLGLYRCGCDDWVFRICGHRISNANHIMPSL